MHLKNSMLKDKKLLKKLKNTFTLMINPFNLNKPNKYIPKRPFKGMQECYFKIPLKIWKIL